MAKSLELNVSGKHGGSKNLGKDGTPRKAPLTSRKNLEKSAGSSPSTGLEKPKKKAEPWVDVKKK